MLDQLHVKDVALIQEATIEFSGGLTVLTGETGAGKTALLSSIKLLIGERADAGAVREGAASLEVEGRFFMGADDVEGRVVRRRVGADGRSRIAIDGKMASVKELAQAVGSKVDLCGQHEHQRLLLAKNHVAMLDAWARDAVGPAHEAYTKAYEDAASAAAEFARVKELSQSAAEKLEEAHFALRRIEEVDPQPGELEELEETLPRAEHSEALVSAAYGARELLSGEDGACGALGQAARVLMDASRMDSSLAELSDMIDSSLIDLEDVSSRLRAYADKVDFDPETLQSMQERMSALQGLMRSFGPSIEKVFERRDQAREVVLAAEDGGATLRAAKKRVLVAEKKLAAAADALDEARAAAIPGLEAAVQEQMARLEMGTAALVVKMERLPRERWGKEGPSSIEFFYRPGASLTPRPFKKIASGGEVSRVMLALKVVLGAADECDTLVFDEVDAGVGGATANALAQVLADLAKTHQVIVVTHLAQVAVVAQSHLLVSKTKDDDPKTTIEPLDDTGRVEEIARMLSGDTSQAACDHARQMLEAHAALAE